MPLFLRWRGSRPKTVTSAARFRPRLQPLDERINPALGFAAQQLLTAGNGPHSAVVGDFNSDGRADVAVSNGTANTLSVYLNTTGAGVGTPTFAAQQTFATGLVPSGMAVGDFNGDGRSDLAVANHDSDTVSVLLNVTPLNAASPLFALGQEFAVGDAPLLIAAGDVNGDGRSDLAVGNNFAGTVSLLLNTTAVGGTTPVFAAKQTFTVGSAPTGVALADFNGDTRLDVAVANSGGTTVSVLLNTAPSGASSFDFANQQTFAVGNAPQGLAVGDFDADGRPDLAATNSNSNTLSVLRNVTSTGLSTASFATQQTFAVGAGSASVAVADFDGDGRADVAVTNSNAATLSVLRNTTVNPGTAPTFAAQQTFTVGNTPFLASVGDFNGDGLPDLVTANNLSNNASVLVNTSTGGSVTTPSLVGQFGTTGIWGYNRATSSWVNLTQANATVLVAAANGNVVASFGGNGVWYYRPTSSWKQLSAAPATALAIDPLGNVYASFAGYGTYEFMVRDIIIDNFNGNFLGSQVADQLAASANSDVVGNFGSAGVSRYRFTTGWLSLATPSAVSLAIGENGDIAASFAGYGVYRYKAGAWAQLNANAAGTVAIGANGTVVASFTGLGIGKYIPYAGGWQSLHNSATALSLAVDVFGNLFATLSGYGVYEFNSHAAWRQHRNSDAGLLGLG